MFDAGAIVGKMLLDKTQWNNSVASVYKDQEKMKSRFSSFAQSFKSNWLAMTAAISAAAITANRLWANMVDSVKQEQMEATFMGIAKSAGIAGENLRKAMQEASAFTVEFSAVATNTSALINRSLRSDQIVQLMRIARAEARKTGESVEQAFNQIAGAVTGGFTRQLRTAYGVNVDATIAVENYARQMGLTKEKVEQFYKSQAIANEIIRQTRKDLAAIDPALLTKYERIQQMQRQYREFAQWFGLATFNILSIFGSMVGIVMSGIADVIDTTAAAIQHAVAFMIGLLEKMVFFIPAWKQALQDLRRQFDDSASNYNMKAQANLRAIGDFYMEIVGAIKDLTNNTRIESEALFSGMSQAAEDMSVRTKQTVDQWLQQLKQDFAAALEFTQGIYSSMQSSFKSIVVDGMKGDLKSLGDYFVAFGNMVIEIIGEIIAKWAAMKVITGFVNAATGIFSAGANIVQTGPQSFGGHEFTTAYNGAAAAGYGAGYADGLDYVPFTGMYKLHQGETVRPGYDASKHEGLTLTIHNLITPEAVAQAMTSKEGEGVIVNVINTNSIRNGSVRRTIKAR